MSNPTGPWRSECIIRGWSGVLAQSRESDPWKIWSLGLVLNPGQSVPTPSPHTKWNGGGSFDADLGGIPILPEMTGVGAGVGRLGHPGHRGKGEISAHRQEQRPLWAGPWRGSVETHKTPPFQQGEPHYANLELQTWPLREEPMHPRQPEVEYSTVVSVRAWFPHGVPGLR